MSVCRRGIVFLDKDGTLITNEPHNVDPDRVALAAGAEDALRTFAAADLDVAVVANQSGVAFGRFTEVSLDGVRERISDLIRPFGVRLVAMYYCPHHPEGTIPGYARACNCRKPGCGLLLRARAEWGVHLGDCWMVGDILDDIEAGHRAGCKTVLIDNGGETQWARGPFRDPDFVVKDLSAAARVVVDHDRTRGTMRMTGGGVTPWT